MSFSNPIVEAGVAGLARLYADRAVTPVEACEAYLSRIHGLDGPLGAFLHVDVEGARKAAHESAERWSEGAPLSILDGQPIAVTANIAVEGLPWHAGLAAYRDRMAPADAACVARLREAGAVVLGLLSLHEGGYAPIADTGGFGRPHNPWAHGYIPGGAASGGGVAVAAGLCAGAIVIDTLGGARIPASLCGVYGHKPTLGLIPTEGMIPVSWTLDHVGVMGRSSEDCAHLLAGASGADAELAAEIAKPSTPDALREAPVAALIWEGVAVDDQTAEAFEAMVAAARDQGLEVETIRLDGVALGDRDRLSLVCAAEACVEHAQALAAGTGFSPAFLDRLKPGTARTAADLAQAYRSLAEMAESVRAQLSPYAALLTPATPQGASLYEAAPPVLTPFTALANVLGLPATAFPLGVSDDGRPLGGQAIAWDDETSLGLARMLGRNLGAPPALQG